MVEKIQINYSNKTFYTLVVIGVFVLIGVGVYASVDKTTSWHSSTQVELDSGESLQEAIDGGSFGGSGTAPSGAVMAFNLEECPSGWLLADGTNIVAGVEGPLDLRGAFIRGFGGDQNGRDVERDVGSYQEDEFESHSHKYYAPSGVPGNAGATGSVNGAPYVNTGSTGGSETRPKNVALIYCVKT